MNERLRLASPFVYAAIFILAFILRFPHLWTIAVVGHDAAEYVWCVENDRLPHAPYILFVWLGYLINAFVSLDLGYSLLSLASAIPTLWFFGQILSRLAGNPVPGWIGAFVVATTPVSILYSGLQEVYSVQLLLLIICWWLAVCRNAPFGCGFAYGCALMIHIGSLFALPATLVFLYRAGYQNPAREQGDSTPAQNPRAHARGSVGRSLSLFVIGAGIPFLICLAWLVTVWVSAYGDGSYATLFSYLCGTAPEPVISGSVVERGIVSLFSNLGKFEVIGAVLLTGGSITLALLPLRLSLPWLALCLPYMAYEVTIGYKLDWGIYHVFIVPALAAGIGLSASSWSMWKEDPRRWGAFLIAVVGALVALPRCQEMAEMRKTIPWQRPAGAPMALAEWVAENTPGDSIVIQPLDWQFAGAATALYMKRQTLFHELGSLVLPGRWLAYRPEPEFRHERNATTDDFNTWLEEERPLMCFDRDTFTSLVGHWPDLDEDQFEPRPILWLERNQSGTSESWENIELLAGVDLGSDQVPELVELLLPEEHTVRRRRLMVYRPAIYYVARKSDSAEPPAWVKNLRELVPENQRGAAEEWEGVGIEFSRGKGRDKLELVLPAKAGADHCLKLVLDSTRWEYIVKCQVHYQGEWVTVGHDMEYIFDGPPSQFADLFFTIPREYVKEDHLRVRLYPTRDLKELRPYRVEIGALNP